MSVTSATTATMVARVASRMTTMVPAVMCGTAVVRSIGLRDGAQREQRDQQRERGQQEGAD